MESDKTKWDRDGYLKLPMFYSEAEIDAVNQLYAAAWADGADRVVVDDLMTGKRLRMRDVSEDDKLHHRFKVNDLYLEIPSIRALALNDRLAPILEELLGHPPALCNSLNFERGSGQPDHLDSLYMTPRSRGHLIAIWVALEDCHAYAGPLRYYPGSHAIPPYEFSNGSTHVIDDEMDRWNRYMREQIGQRGLEPVTFNARKGDVFVWHCYLLHGGSEIRNPELTRRSIVFHFYSEEDARAVGLDLCREGGAYWCYRAHQPVGDNPGELPPR